MVRAEQQLSLAHSPILEAVRSRRWSPGHVPHHILFVWISKLELESDL